MSWWGFKPYVSVAERRRKAQRHVAKLAKGGRTISPVTIEGRTIARTFWGKAWCDNLESYSDFENRLPRGRTYVRNGSVVDLQIEPGRVKAIVSGSEIYNIAIKIRPLAPKTWAAIKAQCAGKVASVIELLQGKLSGGVMEIITRREGGMFPAPKEISLDCSCPDWADMCKHVAAALYGVGARLDEQPELFFKLRQVDHLELIEQVGNVDAITQGSGTGTKKTIAADALADVFGIELESQSPAGEPSARPESSAPADVAAAGRPAQRGKARASTAPTRVGRTQASANGGAGAKAQARRRNRAKGRREAAPTRNGPTT